MIDTERLLDATANVLGVISVALFVAPFDDVLYFYLAMFAFIIAGGIKFRRKSG